MGVEKLTDLKPGKILGEDVLNFQGLLLLKKETQLTEKNLRMLKSWGISEALVKGGQVPGDEGELQQAPAKETENGFKIKFSEKFLGDAKNPVVQDIMTTAMELVEKRRHG